MVYCSVKGCFSNDCSSTVRKFYRFPDDNEKERLAQWFVFCGERRVNTRKMFVCDLHFTKSDFLDRETNLILKKNAVPSLNGPLNKVMNQILSLPDQSVLDSKTTDSSDLVDETSVVSGVDSVSFNLPCLRAEEENIIKQMDKIEQGIEKLIGKCNRGSIEFIIDTTIEDDTDDRYSSRPSVNQDIANNFVLVPTKPFPTENSSAGTSPQKRSSLHRKPLSVELTKKGKEIVTKPTRRLNLTPLQKQHKMIAHFQRKKGLKKYKCRKKKNCLNLNDPKYSIAATAESLGTFNTAVPYHENMIDLENGEWHKLYSPELSNVSKMPECDVPLMVNQLRAKLPTLNNRDKLEVSFLLSMLSFYPEAPEHIRKLLLQRLKIVYVATLFQWTTSLSLFKKSPTIIPEDTDKELSQIEESTLRSSNTKRFEIIVQEKCPIPHNSDVDQL